ncbi:MAG: GLUG motif-containing protein, partial [Candidatus Paceibacterota bacterium]
MKKIFALFFLLFSLFSFDKTFAFSGLGSGTLSDPYQISNGTQLQEMTSSTTANYILVNDIDFSGVATSTWNSGAGFIPINSFSGSLDGKGHKIIGLYINRPGTYNVGLFGDVNPYTTMSIKNIGLENVDITGYYLVGGIVGRMQSGTISNSYTTGKITATESYVGGLIGGNSNTNYSFTINNSYSRANISGKTYVAGLVGSSIGIMINVYSTGILSGTSGIGGLTSTSYGTAISSYWDIQTSGATTSTRGTGKTTSEMKSTSTFQTWNFNKVWDIDPEGIINDGYPYLNVFDDWTDTYHAETLSGSGTSIDPYTITTCNQLQNIKNDLFAYYTLENDIDCSTYSYNGDSYGFYPIAISSSYPFRGSFDGKGHKITGLYMNYPNSYYTSLFGYVGSSISNSTTTIKNFGLEDVDITGKIYTSGITGYFNSGTISGVYTTGNIFQVDTPDAGYAGGLVGLVSSSYNAYISDSYSRANITGKKYVGGAIGSSGGTVKNIYSTGLIKIIGVSPYSFGGLVGDSN